MGHDIHITRKENWFDEEGPEITLQEWADYVKSDPEMRLDGFAEAATPQGTLRIEEAGIAVWTAYSKHGENGNMAWMCWSDGEIVLKSPDTELLVKMYKIAKKLGAKVQGDESEVYDANGDIIKDE